MASVFDKFPYMELDRIILRELELSDLPQFYNYISDPKVNRFISDDDIPKNMEEAEREIEYWSSLYKNRRSLYWAIANKNNNKLIGTCGFNGWSRTHSRVEISYDLSHSYWGRGLMTEALRAICDYAFAAMKVNRIQATVATDNIGSMKVLSKLHFEREGLMKEFGVLHGKVKDFYMYGLTSQNLKF